MTQPASRNEEADPLADQINRYNEFLMTDPRDARIRELKAAIRGLLDIIHDDLTHARQREDDELAITIKKLKRRLEESV